MQASQLQLDELKQKLRTAVDIKVSDIHSNRHAQQAPSQGQEVTAPQPSQPALRADGDCPQGTTDAPAVAGSSKDTPSELPQARAPPSSPDPQKQVDALMGSLPKPRQTEERAVSKGPNSSEREAAALVVPAAKDAAPASTLVATPSTAHTPTAPQVAAQSHRQPVNPPTDVAVQGNNETQAAEIGGQDMAMSPLAEPKALLVLNQAAAQEVSKPMQPLLSSLTPLPPPVFSPARAVPTALQPAAQDSPMGSLPSTGVAAEPAGSAKEAEAPQDDDDAAMADVGAPGEEETNGVEEAQGDHSQPVTVGGFLYWACMCSDCNLGGGGSKGEFGGG